MSTPQPMTDPLAVPDGLPALPEPPAGHRWVYRGMGWTTLNWERVTYAVFARHMDAAWRVYKRDTPGASGRCHYAEAVPSPVTCEPAREGEDASQRRAIASIVNGDLAEQVTYFLCPDASGTTVARVAEIIRDYSNSTGDDERLRRESLPEESGYFHEDTPRTNPQVYEFSLNANPDYDGPMYHVEASFARALERETGELRAALEAIRTKASDTQVFMQDLPSLLEEITEQAQTALAKL